MGRNIIADCGIKEVRSSEFGVRSMKRFLVFFLFSFFCVTGDRAQAAPFTDEIGRQVEVKAPPQRIISVAPSVTEILFALGLGEKVVGVSSYCNYPPEALKKEKVGGYITPSMEKIIALRPDLVIQTADGDLKTFVTRLAGLGIPVYIANPKTIPQVMISILKIGDVTFSKQSAQKLVAAMKEKAQAIKERIHGKPRPRTLPVMAYDPLISSGKGTFVDDLIRLAGGVNCAEKAKGKHPQLSLEEVIAQDPQVIILSSMKSNDPLAEQRQWWSRWPKISAVRSGRIYVIDADLIHRPSPRIVDGLEAMAKAMHPEVFKTGPRGQENKE